jgi:hypothetical protein
MNEHFLEHLDNVGLINNGVVNTSKISRSRLSTLADIAEQSADLTSSERFGREQSIFAQSASLSMGGDRTDYCGTLECRLARTYQLAQFASLYSDRVYVRSFLSKYSSAAVPMYKGFEDLFRQNLIEDLTIVNELRPLIAKGIIVPFSTPMRYCPCCLAKLYLKDEFHAPFSRAYEQLKTEYLDNVSYTLKARDEQYRLVYKGAGLTDRP